MKHLSFSQDGVCRICLSGLPEPFEVEHVIEEYVSGVELLPHRLWIILIDISDLTHMGIRSRQVFSELITQASKHYGGKIELVIAGGTPNLQRFIELFCKGIGFRDQSQFFKNLQEAEDWIAQWLKVNAKEQAQKVNHDPT